TNSDKKVGFVFCPTSNAQITEKMPDFDMLMNSGFPVMLGTDSVASGQSLDLLGEMKYLQIHSNVTFEEMLSWVTINAANYMQWDDMGKLKEGTKPGINLITGFDFENKVLKSTSKIRRIL
ncbi:MAG: hypothetical protein C0599_07375, partial [Salinivirgaceae bacterium]